MENKKNHYYYLTLFTAVLALGAASFNQTEAAENRVLSQRTDLVSIAEPVEPPVEDPLARAQFLSSAWDLATFTPIYDTSIFKDMGHITEPLPHIYSFSMSMTAKSEIVGDDVVINPSFGNGTYVEISEMPKQSEFLVTHVGFWKGKSIDLKVKVNDYERGVLQTDRSLNMMFNDAYFAGFNFLRPGKGEPGVFMDLTYETVDSETGELVAVSGLIPYFNMSNTTMVSLTDSNIENVYGTLDSIIVTRESQVVAGGRDFVGSVAYDKSPPTEEFPNGEVLIPVKSPRRKMTVVYNATNSRVNYVTSAMGNHGMTPSPRSEVPINLPEPVVTGNTYGTDPAMVYKISQDIPLEPTTHTFQNFFMDLPLANVLNPVNLDEITVSTDRGYTLTKDEVAFHRSTTADGGEKITVEVLETFREKGRGDTQGLDFYGRYLTVSLPVSLNSSADLSAYLSADKKLVRVPLTSTTRIDDNFYETISSAEPGFVEASNEGKMTISHVDEQKRQLIPDAEVTSLLGTPWSETYEENGGYRKDKILLGEKEVTEIAISGVDSQYKVIFNDERYAFTMAASSPDDATGATIKQEQEISYKLNVASRAGISYVTPNANNYETVAVKLAGYDADLLDKPSDADLQLPDGTVIGKASYDEGSTSYRFTNLTQKVSWDTDLAVVFQAKTTASATVGNSIELKASVELAFDEDAWSFAGQTAPVTTEIVKAKLILASHPSEISFGTIKRATFGGEQLYPIQSMEADLIVRDERAAGDGTGWKISATLMTDFSTTIDGETYTLPRVLKYIDKETNRFEELNQGEKVLIYDQATAADPLTNVSQKWQANEEGLVLQLFSGQAKDSTYSATLQWQLEDAY